MTSINQFISEETIHALAWTVIHSFWQGLLIALIFSLCYSNMKNKTAKFKYYFSLAALFSIAIAAGITFSAIHESIVVASPETYLVPTHTIADINHAEVDVTAQSADWYDVTLGFLDSNTSSIVLFWMLGLILFLSRMLYGFYFVNQLRFSATSLEDKKWQHQVDKFLVNLGSSRSVEVAQSALVKMPMMIGFLKPIILFPIGVVNAMEAKEVEAIIAHELSHVLRNDYLINIIQSFVEVLFYYHPAVWWLSSIVRAERENSCDDMAISMTLSNVTYAKALLHIGEHSNRINPLAMTFGGKKKKLLLRVQRILNQSQYKPRVMEKIITSTLLFVLIVGISMGANTNDVSAHALIENGSIPSDRVESPLSFAFAERPNTGHNLIELDTLPNRESGSCQMMYYNDDVRVDIWKEDGKLVKLWVDGKQINEADYEKYQAYIDEVPPVPPAPPSPPAAPSQPVPPTPPASPVKRGSKSGGSAIINGDQEKVIYLRKEGGVYKWVGNEKADGDLYQWVKDSDTDSWDLKSSNGKETSLGSKDQMDLLKLKQKLIKDELKVLSEITFIDSLHPTLTLTDLEDGAMTYRFDTDDLSDDIEIQVLIENSLKNIENEQKLLVEKFEKEKKEFEMISNFSELENSILALQLDLEGGFSDIRENILAVHFADGNGTSEYQNFLNSEVNFDVEVLHEKEKRILLNQEFEKQLLSDGLITNVENYNFKLSKKSFRVNGSKADEKLKRKYLDILRNIMGLHIEAQVKFNRSIKPGKTTTTIES